LIAFMSIGAPCHVVAEEDYKVFIALTTPDAQTQTMALVLATQINRQQKVDQILLCGPAGDLVLRNNENIVLKPINKSPQMLLKSLIESGVTVQVCPLYMPDKGVSGADLIDGVTEAKPPLVAERLLARGVKLFTF